MVYNLRYAYDIALCAECQYLGRKTNRERGQHMKSKTTEINVKNTKLQNVGKIQSSAGVTVGGEPEVVEHFKYIGSLKPAHGNCNK